MISVCVDAQGRITGICPDDLTGGCGWQRIETDLKPQNDLFNGHNVALYKLVDGEVVERTAEEINLDEPELIIGLTDIEKLKIRQDATENAVLFLMDMGGML